MLDVHMPHATHTWKDFFIHIATITVGLLIAVGLEQAVEAVHRHHQLNRRQEDLHGEALANHPVGQTSLAHIDSDMSGCSNCAAGLTQCAPEQTESCSSPNPALRISRRPWR
jgi:hypothetical protein